MVNPIAFAGASLGNTASQAATGFLNAYSTGRRDRMAEQESKKRMALSDIALQERRTEQEQSKLSQMQVDDVVKAWNNKDQNGFRTSLSLLSKTNRAAAQELQTYLGGLTKDGAVSATMNLLGASKSTNPQAQDRLLKNGMDSLGVGPEHPIYQDYAELINMPAGEERNLAIEKLLAESMAMGILGEKKGGKSPEEIAKTEAETRNLDARTAKILTDLKNDSDKGELSADKKFDYEQKLSDKYYARTKNYQDVKTSYDTLLTSAEADSGPGDLALITSFMKMLDPGSVVRETEFANAQDTAGLYNRVKNMVTKWKSGERLGTEDRERFVSLSRQYMEAADQREQTVRNQIGQTIKNYGLNAENIFPEKATTEKPKPQTAQGPPKVYQTMQEAEAASASLPKGTRIQVGNEIFEVE